MTPTPTADPSTDAASGPSWSLDTSGTSRVPFSRLVAVEWRKMLDTRGGFWLLAITGLLLVIAVGLTLLVVALNDVAMSANIMSQIMVVPLSVLLPVFAILAVTSEWSQRTGLVTFTLEPHRLRVLLAKFSAVVLLVLATIVLAIALGAVTNLAAAAIAGHDVVWDLEAGALAWTVVSQLLFFVMAFGLGMVLLNTPGAIAVFYVFGLFMPFMVYSTLMAFFEWAQDLVPYIDLTFAMTPFMDPAMDAGGDDVAPLLVAVTIWIVLPLAIGGWRVLRSEPK